MTTIGITNARTEFFDLFDKVVRQHARIVIARRGKDKIAMIPVEDLQKLQRFEDEFDIAAADAAISESSKRIDYDEIRKELGL